jgi:putative component of membrane protein insertase Oxa1/YidC/SpoIIIJ protein YidD
MTGTLTVSPAGQLVAALIQLYQRFLSPYKGFSCAYRVKKKRCSCSEFARRVAVRFGLLKLPDLLRRRFKKCERASKVLAYEAMKPKQKAPSSRTPLLDHCSNGVGEAATECAANVGCELACAACDGI